MNFTSIILTGGKSAIMGTDKGLTLIQEIRIARRVIETVLQIGITKIIIDSNTEAYKQFGIPVFPDILKGKGLLGGIYSGFGKSTKSRNLVLNDDIPLMTEIVIQILVQISSDTLIAVAKHDNRIYNLIDVYDNSLKP